MVKKYILKFVTLLILIAILLQQSSINTYALNYEWICHDGNWYYGTNENYLTGWQKIDNQWYYFDSNGIMLKGWQYINDNWYYLNNDMKTGWIHLNNEWYYLNDNGTMQIGWKKINGKKYFFDANGKFIDGAKYFIIDVSKWQGVIDWQKVKDSNIDGVILRSTYGGNTIDSYFYDYIQSLNEFNIPYGIYHYNTATTTEKAKEQANFMIKTIKMYNARPTFPLFVDIEENGKNTDLNKIAKIYCDQFVLNGYQAGIYANTNYWTNYLTDKGLDLYYKWVANYGTTENNENGTANPNFAISYNLKDYILWQYTSQGKVNGINGNVDQNIMFEWYIKNGWYKIQDEWYYYNNQGYLTTNWQKIDNKWYYLDSNGAMLSGWQCINNKWYYLNNDMKTGWQKIDNKWYYLDSNGAMLSGWQYINNKWYYLNNDMKTGWQKIDNKWYYLDNNGAMLSGWQYINNKWYYLNNDMKTGWQKIDNKWYYLDSNGAMLSGWQYINNKWYYLNNDMKTDWIQINGKWYYLNNNGAMVIGKQIIDQKLYIFDSNGTLIYQDYWNDPYVYVSIDGEKYHNDKTCSNMNEPIKISQIYAEKIGYTQCKKCY